MTIARMIIVMASMAAFGAPGFTEAAGAAFPPVDELEPRPALPDPFTMFDGTPVETPEDWYSKRRPELKALFGHYMYGHAPGPVAIRAEETQRVDTLFGGRATLREIEISFPGLPADAPRIHLALFVPNMYEGPVPVFLGLNKCGNQMVVDDPAVSVTESWLHGHCPGEPGASRGSETDFWRVEYLINRGYAFATFHESDIDPDRHDFTDGIHPFFDLPGEPETHWGTIAAWAWGLQRCVDYLVEDEAIDGNRVCLIGHSRRGKTVLLAAAMDERVALAVPHQSGTGGCALSRDNDQESVEIINRAFPHWFNDNFAKFADREALLPIDQHLLMALVAPRFLLDTAGLQDTWANYESALRGLKAADAVYEFLGLDGLKGAGVVQGGQPFTAQNAGELAQYRRDTPHTLNIGYWNGILDYADVVLEYRDKNYPTGGSVERADATIDGLIPKDAELEIVTQGFDWCEGPVWIEDGRYLLFSDIPPNTVYKWKEGEGLSVYLKPSGYTGPGGRGGEQGSNGLLLDPQGRLVLCQHGDRRVARMTAPLFDPKPEFATIADSHNGKRLNSPNDAAYHRNSDLYFTDPPYGLEGYVDDPTKELDFQGVYRVKPGGGAELLHKGLSRPNGIAFSPDYRTLYVANSDGDNPVWTAFPVLEDGTLGEGRVFFDARDLPGGRRGGGDGLKVDIHGNVYATGPGGVLVIDPNGKYLGTILTGQATSNCAFGDDGSTLYITADYYVMRIRTNTMGMGF